MKKFPVGIDNYSVFPLKLNPEKVGLKLLNELGIYWTSNQVDLLPSLASLNASQDLSTSTESLINFGGLRIELYFLARAIRSVLFI